MGEIRSDDSKQNLIINKPKKMFTSIKNWHLSIRAQTTKTFLIKRVYKEMYLKGVDEPASSTHTHLQSVLCTLFLNSSVTTLV